MEEKDSIDSWNPMVKDYFDPSFNTYTTGPGANLESELQPCSQSKKGSYKLFVGNIPPSLTVAGLKNLFFNFGNPLDAVIIPSSDINNFGFVSYRTQKEAEEAILALNNNSAIFNLKVEFAHSEKDKIAKLKKKQETEETVAYASNVHEKLKVEWEESLQKSAKNVSNKSYDIPKKYCRKVSYSSADKAWYENECFNERYCFKPHIASKHEVVNMPLLEKTNLFDSSRINRKVSRGRGYLECGERVKMPGGLKALSINKVSECAFKYDGPCEFCKTLTTFKCNSCGTWYCSKKCQEEDWDQHKLQCGSKIFEISNSVLDDNSKTNEKFCLYKNSFLFELKIKEEFECSVIKIYGPRFTLLCSPSGVKVTVLTLKTFLKNINTADVNNPKVGDLVLARRKGNQTWARAVILADCKTYFRVALCDSGLVEDVIEIKCPLKQIVGFKVPVVECTVSKYLQSLDEFHASIIRGAKLYFEVTSIDNDFVTGILKSTKRKMLGEVKLSPWEPLFEDGGLQVTNIQSGDMVEMTAFYNEHEIYVRSLKESDVDDYNEVLQDVAGDYYSKEKQDYRPRIGELVSCKFASDGCVYRALVVNMSEKMATVSYVDFGNQEEVTLDLLRPLDLSLKMIRCFAVKVSLKGVLDRPLSVESVDLFNAQLLSENNIFIKFGSTIDSGVYLYPKGYSSPSLNADINIYLEPSWLSKKRVDSSKEILQQLEEYLRYVELPVGKTVDLLVLNIPDWSEDEELEVMGCSAHEDLLYYVYTTLPTEIYNYLTHCPLLLYKPIDGELCLARYRDDVWGRGVCTLPSEEGVTILFIDFGAVIALPYKDIRPFPTELIAVPGLALSCKVKGAKKSEMQAEEVYKVQVLSKESKSEYTVKMLH